MNLHSTSFSVEYAFISHVYIFRSESVNIGVAKEILTLLTKIHSESHDFALIMYGCES